MNIEPHAERFGDREDRSFCPSVPTHEELLARVSVASVAGLLMPAEHADGVTTPALQRVFLDNL